MLLVIGKQFILRTCYTNKTKRKVPDNNTIKLTINNEQLYFVNAGPGFPYPHTDIVKKSSGSLNIQLLAKPLLL